MQYVPTSHWGLSTEPNQNVSIQILSGPDGVTSGTFYAGKVKYDWYRFEHVGVKNGEDPPHTSSAHTEHTVRVASGKTTNAYAWVLGGGGGGGCGRCEIDEFTLPARYLQDAQSAGGGAGELTWIENLDLSAGRTYKFVVGAGGGWRRSYDLQWNEPEPNGAKGYQNGEIGVPSYIQYYEEFTGSFGGSGDGGRGSDDVLGGSGGGGFGLYNYPGGFGWQTIGGTGTVDGGAGGGGVSRPGQTGATGGGSPTWTTTGKGGAGAGMYELQNSGSYPNLVGGGGQGYSVDIQNYNDNSNIPATDFGGGWPGVSGSKWGAGGGGFIAREVQTQSFKGYWESTEGSDGLIYLFFESNQQEDKSLELPNIVTSSLVAYWDVESTHSLESPIQQHLTSISGALGLDTEYILYHTSALAEDWYVAPSDPFGDIYEIYWSNWQNEQVIPPMTIVDGKYVMASFDYQGANFYNRYPALLPNPDIFYDQNNPKQDWFEGRLNGLNWTESELSVEYWLKTPFWSPQGDPWANNGYTMNICDYVPTGSSDRGDGEPSSPFIGVYYRTESNTGPQKWNIGYNLPGSGSQRLLTDTGSAYSTNMDSWNHFVMTYNHVSSSVELYINGNNVLTGSLVVPNDTGSLVQWPTSSNSPVITMGREAEKNFDYRDKYRNSTPVKFNQLRVYNKVLTPQEVQINYSASYRDL